MCVDLFSLILLYVVTIHIYTLFPAFFDTPNIVIEKFLSFLLRHRIFTYVTWRAAHGPRIGSFNFGNKSKSGGIVSGL